jgi:putative chitobiose transport system substrate-binding protein
MGFHLAVGRELGRFRFFNGPISEYTYIQNIQRNCRVAMMGLKNWKRWAIFGLLGLCLSWMVSCGGTNSPETGKGQPPKGKTEIKFWTMSLEDKYKDYFKGLIANFEKQNPTLAVNWHDEPWATMQTKILAAVSSKTAPDVVNLNPAFAAQLAGRDAWLTLNDKVDAKTQSGYLSSSWKASTFNGKIFGLPWYLTSRIAIYNSDLFKKAGLSAPPKTYTELATIAKVIKEKTKKYAFFVTAVPEDSGEIMESFVQMGVKLIDAQGKAAFNSPEGKAAFDFWTNLRKEDLIPPEVTTEGHRYAVEQFQAGQTALLFSGPEFLSEIATNAPGIAKVALAAPQIMGSTGKKNVAVMNVVIPKDTEHPDAAVKFALFLTNPQNQLSFAKAAKVLPSTTASLQDPYFSKIAPDASSLDKALIVSASQLTDAEVLIPMNRNIKSLQRILYENLQATMNNTKTTEQALKDAEQAWNQEYTVKGS